MFLIAASSPEPRQCPYLGKFTVTGVNKSQRNSRESQQRLRHSQSLKFGEDYFLRQRKSRPRRTSDSDKRSPSTEDFQLDEFVKMRKFWLPTPDYLDNSPDLELDYFGDYLLRGEHPPRKRSPEDLTLTFHEVLRPKRENSRRVASSRGKREGEEPRCNSEVTTLTVGCSTADRMEFQTDCVDEDAVTGNGGFLKIFSHCIKCVCQIN